MVRLLEARGIPIVCLKNNERVGYLGEPIYNEDEEIRGFLVDGAKGLGKKYVEIEDILRVQKDACLIYSDTAVRKIGRIKPLLKQKSSMTSMIGKDVVDGAGRNLGIVRDLAFDMETGTIEGIELSRGFMEDLRTGRRLISLRDGIEVESDKVTVRDGSYS